MVLVSTLTFRNQYFVSGAWEAPAQNLLTASYFLRVYTEIIFGWALADACFLSALSHLPVPKHVIDCALLLLCHFAVPAADVCTRPGIFVFGTLIAVRVRRASGEVIVYRHPDRQAFPTRGTSVSVLQRSSRGNL